MSDVEADQTSNTPEEALTGFYTAILRDQDFERACSFASLRFRCRPSRIYGRNIDADDPDPGDLQVLRRKESKRGGTCLELTRRIWRAELYPFEAGAIEYVRIAADGRTAEAVTEDGSAGLEVVDGAWRVLWVYGRGRLPSDR